MTTTINRPRVLVIDDELGPRESLRILLKPHYEVFCADSVKQGLALLQEKEPDVVVSDIRMPDQNGIEGLERIREIDALVPVIMLTGYGALETAQAAIRHGASDYMKKPFDAKDMLENIQRHVVQSQLARRRERSRLMLEELNQKLEAEIEQKREMAAMGQASAELVHDLRNPMTVVLGYVQLLAEDLRSDHSTLNRLPQTAEYIETIEQHVHRCKDLTETWLDISRTHRITLKPLNLCTVIEQALDDSRPLALPKNAEIKRHVAGPAMGILGHAVQLRQALNNLFANAIDALPNEGGELSVSAQETDDTVTIRIKDNGEGISPERLPHIFTAFYTSKSPDKGTGLGLFISKKIIEHHRGRLTIDSTLGQGTCITITLPPLSATSQNQT